MPVVSHLTDQQSSQIPAYIEKWQWKWMLTNTIDRPKLQKGIQDVCAEIGIEVPHEFLYYPNPPAIWRDFDNWKSKITRVLSQYWAYQIPLSDLDAMYRLWGPGNTRPTFNFAAKRYSPGVRYALCETEDSDETSGTVITRELHGQVWKQFQFYIPVVSYELFDYYSGGESGPHINYLGQRAWKEDPSSQTGFKDQSFIGPELWLLQELACVDFCHQVLGIDRNERLYCGLEALVEHGSFCGVFGQLCVACERPSQIQIEHEAVKFTFSDGETFTTTIMFRD